MHMAVTHHHTSEVRLCIDGDVCPVCMLMFSTRGHVLAHLHEKSETCRDHVLMRAPVVSNEEAELRDVIVRENHQANKSSGVGKH